MEAYEVRLDARSNSEVTSSNPPGNLSESRLADGLNLPDLSQEKHDAAADESVECHQLSLIRAAKVWPASLQWVSQANVMVARFTVMILYPSG